MVSKESKNSFVWHGDERMNQVLGELQDEAIKLWPEDARSAGLIAVHPPTAAETTLTQQRVTSLGRLTQSFIQLFLVGVRPRVPCRQFAFALSDVQPLRRTFHQNPTVCVQDAVNKLKAPSSNEDPAQEKGRLRRLYDIAVVLTGIGLLEKAPHQPARLTVRWVGIPPLQLRQQFLSQQQALATTDSD